MVIGVFDKSTQCRYHCIGADQVDKEITNTSTYVSDGGNNPQNNVLYLML